MTIERLQKILSNAGVASRRVAEAMVLEGRVAVNGTVQSTLGARADIDADEITLDGVPVLRSRYRYFLLNKPAGIVTTASDELGRDTVLDMVPIGDIQLHPVGRLDKESEGLLILTNDGHLTGLLTHPRYGVEKEYLVALDAPLTRADLQRVVRGVESDGERLHASTAIPTQPPVGTELHEEPEFPAWAILVLRQGRNREVRRLMEAVGRKVMLLRRIRLGPVHLGTLGSGSFRELTNDEVIALYRAAKAAETQSEAMARRDESDSGRFRRDDAQPERGPRRAPAQSRVAAPRPPAGGRGRTSPGPRSDTGRADWGPDRAGGSSQPRSGDRGRVAPPRGASEPTGRGEARRPGAGSGDDRPRRSAQQGPEGAPRRSAGGPRGGDGGPRRSSGQNPAAGGPGRSPVSSGSGEGAPRRFSRPQGPAAGGPGGSGKAPRSSSGGRPNAGRAQGSAPRPTRSEPRRNGGNSGGGPRRGR